MQRVHDQAVPIGNPQHAARPTTVAGDPISVAPGFPLQKIGTWLSTVIHSSLDGVVVIDEHGDIALINREAGRLFNYPAAQLAGKSLAVLFPNPARQEQFSQMTGFAAAKVITGRRLRIKLDLQGLRANGEEFIVSAAISRVTIENAVYLAIILRELI